MSHELKRSNAPFFWLLFGAGGMLSALIGPVLVLITGVLVPLGLLAPETLSYDNVVALAQNPIGKLFLFAVIALFFWHAGHRILHTLHDVGVHAGTDAKLICYGLPLVASAVVGLVLLRLGF